MLYCSALRSAAYVDPGLALRTFARSTPKTNTYEGGGGREGGGGTSSFMSSEVRTPSSSTIGTVLELCVGWCGSHVSREKRKKKDR